MSRSQRVDRLYRWMEAMNLTLDDFDDEFGAEVTDLEYMPDYVLDRLEERAREDAARMREDGDDPPWERPPESESPFSSLQAQFERDLLPKMAASHAALLIAPREDCSDAGFALQIGAAVVLGKPILLLVPPGAVVNGKLRALADRVVPISRPADDPESLEYVKSEVAEHLGAMIEEILAERERSREDDGGGAA